jgi:2-succinyl-5-enolpyruvyl-6-hydroxy-3-cyclohexene-1-carboxylate synthase
MPPEPGTTAAATLVAEWSGLGLKDAFISPGARSTAMVLALAASPGIRKHVVTDERSAAFAALGRARAGGRPVLLVCTSGTAAANYLPALIEASLSAVPLLVVTADRPPEVHDWRAAQTITQVGLFASCARWAVAMPTPGADGPDEAYLRATACRAWSVARDQRGPVHLNLPLREPLLAADHRVTPLEVPARPWLAVATPERCLAGDTLATFAGFFAAERGLIVCGPDTGGLAAAPAVAALAERLRWPILADPLSGLRTRATPTVDAYDVLVRDEAFSAAHRPAAVLRLGTAPASKPLARFLDATAAPTAIVAGHDWPNPEHRGGLFVHGDAGGFCDQVLAGDTVARRDANAWWRDWNETSSALRAALDRELAGSDPRFSGRVALALIAAEREGAHLTVGNSMPVRDLDTWVAHLPAGVECVANRGANGIDGVLSSALGAAADGSREATLYLGDQSLLHDAGALASSLARSTGLRIVVANDDGGGIFEQLPQQALGEVFETYFAAPHGLSIAGLAAGAGLPARSVADASQLAAALAELEQERPAGDRRAVLVEVRTDRGLDRRLRSELPRRALAAVLSGGRRVSPA